MSESLKDALCAAANHVVVFGQTARMRLASAMGSVSVSFPAGAVPAVARHFWQVSRDEEIFTQLRCDCGRQLLDRVQLCRCGCGVVGRLGFSDLIAGYERENGIYGLGPQAIVDSPEKRWEWDFDETTLWSVFDAIRTSPGKTRKFYHRELSRTKQPLRMIHFVYILDELLGMNAIHPVMLPRENNTTVGFVPDADASCWPEFPSEWSYIA